MQMLALKLLHQLGSSMEVMFCFSLWLALLVFLVFIFIQALLVSIFKQEYFGTFQFCLEIERWTRFCRRVS